ncbi:MAG TPA: histidine kinase dimerization/phospho-acceptor domain-containing protein [Sphingobium sp.]|uniref:histidine kinase dimerization/phospho-acceptor domain-containing protein n=1 Tax=Sphingobium sp. TaxID=1912891 RepID=UPI002ED4526A
MRFNDLFATVLSGRAESEWSRAILWRQCIDLLAQYGQGSTADLEDLDRVTETLLGLRNLVSTDQKLAALGELGGRLSSPRLVRLLLGEDAPIQVAVMNRARLPDGAWPTVIAEAGPLARSVLRQRADMGPDARRALDAFGLADMSLIDLSVNVERVDAPSVVSEAPLNDQSQIRRIVDRIERFTSERQERLPRETASIPADEPVETIASFTFLTDADGVIQTVHGASRALLAGLRLATPSLDRSTGPDGQILGAFRRRGAFRDGRLTIGDGVLAGCWLVDGDPQFDQRTGRFTGYRGHTRRANDRDLAPSVKSGPSRDDAQAAMPTTSDATSMRQLIHELRTPLSGVMGFAELIETQLLGPVSDSYRSMAENIVEDVRSLVDILDDLDLANRTDRLRAPAGATGCDATQFLREAVTRIALDTEGRARIALDMADGLPAVDVAPMIAERMIAHFVRALTGCIGAETLVARGRLDDNHLLIEIDRPVAMAGLSEEQLFDSGFEHVAVNMDAPVLGVGFALRLVRRLAQANKGSFAVHPGHFTLALPVPAGTLGQKASS